MKILKLKKIKPLNTQILLSNEKYDEDGGALGNGLILDSRKVKGMAKLYQKVIDVGPLVRYVKPGDYVQINPTRYIKVEHPEDEDSIRGIVKVRNDYSKFYLPTITINGEDLILIYEQDIDFIIEDFEEV